LPVFQLALYGADESRAILLPSTKKLTETTPVLSLAEALIFTCPVTVEPSAGELIATPVGTMVSIVHERLAGELSVMPAGLIERTWKVCDPSDRPV
jgi:hypothetical protein